MDLMPLTLISPLLIAAGYYDLRYMRIPNSLSIIAVALFFAALGLFPMDDVLGRLLIAAVVFSVGFAGFCFRILGGGDVKFLAALMLFVPVESVIIFANVFSAALLLGVMAIVAVRNLPSAGLSKYKAISGSAAFPMGISIAGAGLLHPLAMTWIVG